MTLNSPTQEKSLVRYDVSLADGGRFLFVQRSSHYRIYEKMGAHPVESGMGRPARFSACGRPTRARYRWSATSTVGTRNRTNCRRAVRPESGKVLSLASARARSTSSISTPMQKVTRLKKPTQWHFSARRLRAPLRWYGIWTTHGNDSAFLETRAAANSLHAPISIYEVHLGSWMRIPEEGNRSLSLSRNRASPCRARK